MSRDFIYSRTFVLFF